MPFKFGVFGHFRGGMVPSYPHRGRGDSAKNKSCLVRESRAASALEAASLTAGFEIMPQRRENNSNIREMWTLR